MFFFIILAPGLFAHKRDAHFILRQEMSLSANFSTSYFGVLRLNVMVMLKGCDH